MEENENEDLNKLIEVFQLKIERVWGLGFQEEERRTEEVNQKGEWKK